MPVVGVVSSVIVDGTAQSFLVANAGPVEVYLEPFGGRVLPGRSSVIAGQRGVSVSARTSSGTADVTVSVLSTFPSLTPTPQPPAGDSNDIPAGSVTYDDFSTGLVTRLDGTYAPLGWGRPVFRGVALGDSITLAADDNSTSAQGASWPTLTGIVSGQTVRFVRNAGVFGNTSADMLARFDTDVTPYSPTVVTVLAGTNDIGTGVSLATYQANIAAIVAKIRGIRAVPVLATIPPTDAASPVNRKALISQWNAWLRLYASTNGLTILDFFSVLADPVTGGYKSTLTSGDNIHPNGAGYAAMAAHAASLLAGGGTLSLTIPLCVDDFEANSSVAKGCFTGFTGSALPTGWVDNAGTPTGSVISYTTDSQVPGQMVTVTSTASSGARQIAYPLYCGATTLSSAASAGATSLVTVGRADRGGVLFLNPGGANEEIVKVASSTGGGPQTQTLATALRFAHSAGEPVVASFQAGDTVIFSGRYTSDGNQQVRIGTIMGGTAPYSPLAVSSVTAAVTRGVWHQRFTVPAGFGSPVNFFVQVAAGTGVFSFGQVGIYNATRLGA